MSAKHSVSDGMRDIWREKARDIMEVMKIRQVDLGEACGLSRQSIHEMLTSPDYRMSVIAFRGTIHAFTELIRKSSMDAKRRALASAYVREIEQAFGSL